MSSRDEGGEEGRDGKDGDGGGDEDGAGGTFEVCIVLAGEDKDVGCDGEGGAQGCDGGPEGVHVEDAGGCEPHRGRVDEQLERARDESAPRPEETGKPARVPPRTKRAQGPAVPPRRPVKFRTGAGR